MNESQFTEQAKTLVLNHSNLMNGWKEGKKQTIDDVYVVWLGKVLQNNKAMLSTNVEDGRYYEVTYNGDKNEFYLDSYVKEVNLVVKGSEIKGK